MTDAPAVETKPGKTSLLPLLLGVVLAAILGAGGFFTTYSGMLDFSEIGSGGHAAELSEMPDVVFVPIEPVLVSLPGTGRSRHLRFRAQLETEPAEAPTVEALMPRILDVLNGYLRAIDVTELERPTSLIRIRSQMLRRIQLVVGDGKVRDLLVIEFVLD